MNYEGATLLLRDREEKEKGGIISNRTLLAMPHYWQVPAATEKMAFESMAQLSGAYNFDYLGFPWATLIDGLKNSASATWELLPALRRLSEMRKTRSNRCATVAQHIHAAEFIDYYKACGVTDVFWSHARWSQKVIKGVRIHPFPLFPAQTPIENPTGDIFRKRKYLTNFIGAYNPKVYLTNVRERIFEDEGRSKDILIIKREAWHFNRAVYEEQMKGVNPDEARLQQEKKFKEEYLNVMKDSTFTLCPSGSGPNSIRIFESLALGSIPIILTKGLALPGDLNLWKSCCVIEEDSAEGYHRAIETVRKMGAEEIQVKLNLIKTLYDQVKPTAYGNLVVSEMGK
ncbi:exostosin domain-containing protein [Neptunicoccus sediminis]|uniref:exostosin domain-containing protein n=1 Tax=Neptunicoccus sediminis TaxID=1892596 RepID=UPI000846101E|nr:exostosin family protein [Neptunicoccus sediminis]